MFYFSRQNYFAPKNKMSIFTFFYSFSLKLTRLHFVFIIYLYIIETKSSVNRKCVNKH